ncbi:MAG TPA: PAS domain S-box protein, partial [Anaerolineaceae bacterium]|nr:PAS domain S-box protein [Anaerolineaceae bacterium]
RDPNGAPRYIVVLSKDITERKRAERIQAATFRISQAVNSSATLDELFHSIYSILNELFPARNLFFALYDETKDLLRFPFFVDEYDPPPLPKEPGKGITEYVLRTGKPLLATPAVFDDLVAQGEVESIGAPSLDWLGVPLKVKGRTIGVLVTQTYDVNRRLGEKEIDIMNFVSDQVAMAIDRKMVETLRMESEARLRRITDNMLDLVSETGPDGVIRYASPSHTAVLGYQPDALVGKSIRELLHEEDQEKFAENLATALSQKRATRNELRFLHADGYTLWMDVMSNPLFNEKGETIGAVHGSRDISGRKQAEEALRQSEERYRNLVEYQGEGICILDPTYRFLFANPAAERIFAVEADGLTGRNLEDFIEPDSLGVLETQKGQRESGVEGTYEIEVCRPGGEQRSLLITSTPWMDTSGDYIGSFMIFRDISERKQVEEKLHFLSMHDALTGLFNRAYFEEQIALMECAPKGPISVVFTDLNGLKVTNDTLGHATGDELLRQAAIMLRTAFRGDDVVARIGGDEFGVLLPGVDAPAAEKAVQRLRSRIVEHNRKKNALQISIAIGVATSEGESLREMLNLADQR